MSKRVELMLRNVAHRCSCQKDFGLAFSEELDILFKSGMINLREDKPDFLCSLLTKDQLNAYTTYEHEHLSYRGYHAIEEARERHGSNFDLVCWKLPDLMLYCKKDFSGMQATPPLSNRGCMKYRPGLKVLRDVKDTEPEKGYFNPLWTGYDSVQECFNIEFKPCFIEIFEQTKALAIEAKHEISMPSLKFGKTEFQMLSGGSSGFKYVMQTDDILLMISNPETEWSCSVRYLSAGLIEYGIEFLRQKVFELLDYLGSPRCEDYARLSRVDVATDFYSEKFGKTLRPSILDGLVVPSRCKVRFDELLSGYLNGGLLETLTFGTKKSLQIQIYDKSKEIIQASGKTYFYKLWGMEARENVWRCEVRFFSEFLRNRGILTFEDFEEYRNELIGEALNIRRLTIPNPEDTNRSRWPYHPVYTFVRRQFRTGNFGVKIGRYVTGRRSDLIQKSVKRIAGDLRSLCVLRNFGFYDERDIQISFSQIFEALRSDKKHLEKIERSRERYMFVSEAVA